MLQVDVAAESLALSYSLPGAELLLINRSTTESGFEQLSMIFSYPDASERVSSYNPLALRLRLEAITQCPLG